MWLKKRMEEKCFELIYYSNKLILIYIVRETKCILYCITIQTHHRLLTLSFFAIVVVFEFVFICIVVFSVSLVVVSLSSRSNCSLSFLFLSLSYWSFHIFVCSRLFPVFAIVVSHYYWRSRVWFPGSLQRYRRFLALL